MVSAIERFPLFLFAIKRIFYETMTVIPSVPMNSVRYREVYAIKRVRYKEVPLYIARHYSTPFLAVVLPLSILYQFIK